MSHRVLVVDDDPVVVRLISSLLKEKGFTVETAEDGLDALAKIEKNQPDLVILDIMMPEINGYDVCYQMRFNDKFKHIPIIILSRREKEIDSAVSQRANIDYLSKPLEADLLFEKIDKFLLNAD